MKKRLTKRVLSILAALVFLAVSVPVYAGDGSYGRGGGYNRSYDRPHYSSHRDPRPYYRNHYGRDYRYHRPYHAGRHYRPYYYGQRYYRPYYGGYYYRPYHGAYYAPYYYSPFAVFPFFPFGLNFSFVF